MTSKVQMSLRTGLGWVKLGLENKRYDAALNMLNDLIAELDRREAEEKAQQAEVPRDSS